MIVSVKPSSSYSVILLFQNFKFHNPATAIVANIDYQYLNDPATV